MPLKNADKKGKGGNNFLFLPILSETELKEAIILSKEKTNVVFAARCINNTVYINNPDNLKQHLII